MSNSDVTRAQAGDRAAFARLVARYQRMAVAYAAGWVGDQAEDAAQDAFIEAFLHLGDLQQPAAFPGWLRSIVRKQCDRRTRSRRPRALASDADLHALPAAPRDDGALDRRWLLGRVAALPEHERLVVALHHLAGEPLQAISDFLELPVSTLKKRLFAARARLRAQEANMHVLEKIDTPVFSERISLFLAVRAGDVTEARSILARRPELLNAEETWSLDEALGAGLPLAHRVPPLVLAAGRGDLPMLEMLLEQGADVERSCGCNNRESALWLAARCGHVTIVEALQRAGADPDARNAAGFSPAEAARLSACERAIVQDGRIETGIKAIDVLAPLEPGMLVRVHGQAETGLMVLIAELSSRLGDAVWLTLVEPAYAAWHEADLRAFAAQSGIAPRFGEDFRGRAVFVFSDERRRAELEARLPELREARIAFVIDPWAQATREGGVPVLAPPYDALIATDPELARARIYPAIDRRASRSNARVPERHRLLAEAVRASSSDAVCGYFQQWFGVYQHQSAQPGEYVSLADALAGFASRLS